MPVRPPAVVFFEALVPRRVNPAAVVPAEQPEGADGAVARAVIVLIEQVDALPGWTEDAADALLVVWTGEHFPDGTPWERAVVPRLAREMHQRGQVMRWNEVRNAQ